MISESSSPVASPTAFSGVITPIRHGSLHRRLVLATLKPMKLGHLRMEFADGKTMVFGADAQNATMRIVGGVATTAVIRVRRETFFKRCVLAGDIGFGEAYVAGDWDTPDIAAVIAWFILNHDSAPTLSGSARKRAHGWVLNGMRFANRLDHLLRPNTRSMARRNISAHYDLSNAFFALFLDQSMMYSSARWASPDQTLEQAQVEKNDALCRRLRLAPGHHVLEIGTGWGAWAIHAATHYGCRVTSVTISREQFVHAQERVNAAGLADRVDVQLRDFRDVTGRYDRIVSIEMMEALGHGFQRTFAETIDRVLKPEGLVALQFITCPDARYGEFRRGVDFIQKHIFPGSLLLSLNRVNDLLARAGGFVLNECTDFGHDYARTLREWHARFLARLPEVRALGFDETFIRRWSYYLGYCEAAFALRNISVVHTLHTRANNLDL